MTLHDMLQDANLAALGLLDVEEHAAFERALLAAPPAVREQIRREQARWSMGGELLPQVEPPAALRDRVMDSVRAAMVDQDVQASSLGLVAPSVTRHRVSPLWRAGAVGLLAACVALSAAFVYVTQNQTRTTSLARANTLLESTLTGIGPAFVDDVLFDQATTRTFFAPSEGFAGQIALLDNPDWESPQVFSAQMATLAQGEQYSLVEVDDGGKVVRELATFDGHVQRETHSVTRLEKGSRIALVVHNLSRPLSADKALAFAVVG